MYRIRLHGRGGQGMKTASRILGTALFAEGFEVQDAPRYGAERRGAPIFAYVRADKRPIHERGIIRRPDLVVVADDSLLAVPAAGVLTGLDDHAVLLLSTATDPEDWSHRLNFQGVLLTMPLTRPGGDVLQMRFVAAACAGAAARLVGVIARQSLRKAVETEIAPLGAEAVRQNMDAALSAYEAMADHESSVTPGAEASAQDYEPPDWTVLPFEDAQIAAPAIHAAATSVEVRTGLWRTMRPVIAYDRCKRCWWVCSSLCPDSAITLSENGYPKIDYEHCKGCMICVAQCPPHAIEAIAEVDAQRAEEPQT